MISRSEAPFIVQFMLLTSVVVPYAPYPITTASSRNAIFSTAMNSWIPIVNLNHLG